ncbi:MAG: restriction endonuclease [Desulfobulbus propionicus]|nr:MAG: restriction endonuclease [Desulfobulbus propionicus]
MQQTTPVNKRFDGHLHTFLCQHATGQMEEYVLAAIEKKLHTICFLEHLETGILGQPRGWLTPADFTLYFAEGARLRALYKDKITILLGIEAGINTEEKKELYSLIQSLPVDRTGISRHFFRIGDQHYNLLSGNKRGMAALLAYGKDKVLDDYFESILQTLHDIKVDVVCHLDAAFRHVAGLSFNAHHHLLIEQILDYMAYKDIALEVNTSGFTLRGHPYPNKGIIEKALRKQIRLEAGSDAHAPEQVGRFFDLLPGYCELNTP